jgi:hypothetical protein
MLCRDVKKGKIFLTNISSLPRFTARSGYVGFTDEDKIKMIQTGRDLRSDQMALINPTPVPSMRVFLQDLQGFTIPQLCLYPAEAGWPLCFPGSVSQFRSGYSWPQKKDRFFVTIPIPHITYGIMYSKDPLHHFSVFHSKDLLRQEKEERFNPFKDTEESLMGEYSADSSLRTFNLDRNSTGPLLNLFGDGEYRRVESFGFDMDTEELFADIGPFVFSTLDNYEFQFYLALWLLYYPHKWITLKNKLANSTGGPDGDYQGYASYYFHTRDDTIYGKGKALKYYFNSKGSMGFSSRANPTETDFENNFFWDLIRPGKEESYTVVDTIPGETVKAMAIVRTAIEANKSMKSKFKHYPFRKYPQKLPGGGKHFLNAKGIKVVSQILRDRKFFQEKSIRAVIEGTRCPKCSMDLEVPAQLYNSQPDTSKLVCIDCGYKYLLNMVNALGTFSNGLSGSDYFLYFEDYPLSEVSIFEEAAVEV